jgi:hypothetical protein
VPAGGSRIRWKENKMKKTHISNNKNKELFEFTDLIHKEKEEAIQRFRKQEFGSRLKQRIKEEESKTPSPSVFWLRKLIIAAGAALILVVLGWAVVTQLFAPTPYERDARAVKKALVQAFETHELMIAQRIPQIEPQPGPDNLHEFEWSLKRVVYSIQRENIPDSDIPQIFSQVLLKAELFREREDEESEELKQQIENGHLFEKNPQQTFDQIQD